MAGRAKQTGAFWLRLVCFALSAVLLVVYATYVLTPKHDYGVCSMINLYA